MYVPSLTLSYIVLETLSRTLVVYHHYDFLSSHTINKTLKFAFVVDVVALGICFIFPLCLVVGEYQCKQLGKTISTTSLQKNLHHQSKSLLWYLGDNKRLSKSDFTLKIWRNILYDLYTLLNYIPKEILSNISMLVFRFIPLGWCIFTLALAWPQWHACIILLIRELEIFKQICDIICDGHVTMVAWIEKLD